MGGADPNHTPQDDFSSSLSEGKRQKIPVSKLPKLQSHLLNFSNWDHFY